jgi:uncharacterized iron-regulated protein
MWIDLTVNLGNKLSLLLATMLFLAACASAPVQEMSDARQAIRSAEEADAVRYAPQQLRAAQSSLEKAQDNLEAGAYWSARRLAMDAWYQAIEAREQAARLKKSNR